MNTDKILDFIVNYYIWFILGGFIIIMAIIGFIADRKKLLPSKNEPEKAKNKKKDEFNFDDEDLVDEGSKFENKESDENTKIDDSSDYSEKTIDNNTENLQDSWNIQPTMDNASNDKTDEYADEDQTMEDNHQNEDDNYIPNDNADIQYGKNGNIWSDSDNYNAENEQLGYTNDGQNEKQENVGAPREYSDDLQSEKIQEIKEDITKIDDMFPNKLDDAQDQNDYKQEIDKNVGDNPEQTLQVNYSQLREMVEDIIAETKNENNQTKSDNEQMVVNNQTIEDVPLPNLDHISVDAIKAQDEDEDDVWKF